MQRDTPISRAALSLLVFGVYLMCLGLILILIPNVLLGIVGMPPTHEVWIRMLGMVTLFLGIYHTTAARAGVRSYLWVSVALRFVVPLFTASYILLGLAQPALLLVGVVDFLTAIWTLAALRSEPQSQQTA